MTSVHAIPMEQFEPRARSLMEVHPQDDGTDDDNLASSILSSVPRLSAKSSSCTGNLINIKSDEHWTIRAVPNGEEELYSRGKCVYWTRNSLIIKSFNFTDQVVKLFWTQFNNRDHICIALSSGISIFNRLGQHFQVPLPFAYQDIYVSILGLIIERNSNPLDDCSLPLLFALTHPTQEVSPILFKLRANNSQHASKLVSYSMPTAMSIVACHDSLPICLIYNSQDCQHSLWRIRTTTTDEIDEYQRMNEESTLNTFNNQSCSFRGGEGYSQASLSVSGKQQKSSFMHLSNQSTSNAINFSPKIDMKSKHSALGNLAASRLGAGGGAPITSETVVNSTNFRSFNSMNTMNMMSTPNRNRIINYLRDNIEEPILPEITLEQIWSESKNNSLKGNKFFSTVDLIGNNYIVVVTTASTQLKIIKFETNNNNQMEFSRVTYITAIDAEPLDIMKMMLVIDNNKNFILYSGFDRVTHINVPLISVSTLRTVPISSPSSLKHSTEMTPIQMSSARKRTSIGERMSLGSDSSIQQMFQACSPVPHARYESKIFTAMSSNDIKRIEHIIDKTVYVMSSNNKLAKFEIPSICQTKCVKGLLDSMQSLVSKELGLALITGWYQTRRSSNESNLMSARDELKLFMNWFMSSLGIECNYFDINSNNNNNKLATVKSNNDQEGPELSLRLVHSSPTKKTKRSHPDIESNPMLANLNTLFYAMHLVLEDMLLMKLNYHTAKDLVELLLVLACILKHNNYQEYYWLLFPKLQDKFGCHKTQLENLIPKVELLSKPAVFQTHPPGVMDFIRKIINKSQIIECPYNEELSPFPYIKEVTDNIYVIISLMCEMFGIGREKAMIAISSSTTNYPLDVNVLDDKSYDLRRSKKADENVVQLMVDMGKDRNYLSRLPAGINLYLWDAILNCRESPPTDWSEACFNLIGRMDLVSLCRGRTKVMTNRATTNNNNNSNNNNGIKRDGCEDETLGLLFPDDIRVSEAHRMLASDNQVEFSITQRQGATEEESRDETQRHLYLLNVRTMAMPVGRGAIRLRTYSPVIGESFEVPRLELSGRPLSEDRPIDYPHDISVYPWPFFHNGVAAGLTICASTANNIIDSTWINYNRPRSNIPHGADMRDRDLTAANINNEHAGFLFALGLNGHLEKLSLMALHDYLCQNNDLTKLAILLGMSAAKRGSKDNNIIKVLSIHVDALLPPNSTELDVPAPVHAASIIGVGLLYQGSSDSHISKVLLEEIGRLPGPEANSHVDRESYSLSAGLAFGLVNLCKGGSSTISSSDQLRLYMLGGRRKPLSISQKDRYFKQDCHRGEEEYINTHITSPGGTLGLGLMYHRSGNQSVANWMRAPDTQTLLEYVRPDFLILRMLSYGLIMWNEIQATDEWIDSHIPQIVKTHAFTRNPSPVSATVGRPNLSTSNSSTGNNNSIDYELISQAYCNIVAGCCMAVAMRFAGTADKNAYKIIYKRTKMLIGVSNKTVLAEHAGRPCIEACLNVLVTSMAVVMAGTGDLGVMRVCRYLRSRLTQHCVFYGSYMAVHIALGILFLGACRFSLSTSPESIGALVCALYPIYPNHCSDNRYHLQALRHLYVLAAEPRLLIPRDILTNKPVYVNVTVKQRPLIGCEQATSKIRTDNDGLIELKLRAPCLMPEVDSIDKVYVDDDRYWRIEINNKEALMRCLFQDQGCLSVRQQAHSANNQPVQDIRSYIIDNIPQGIIKTRKSAALTKCVKEDRVEQYSALNELLTKSIDVEFKNITLEQMLMASTLSSLAPNGTNEKNIKNKQNDSNRVFVNKMDLLMPVISELNEELSKKEVFNGWCDYLSMKTDWTNTSTLVANYICLNDLKKSTQIDEDLLSSIRDMNIYYINE